MPPSALEGDGSLGTGKLRYQQASASGPLASGAWWKTLPDAALHREVDAALAQSPTQRQLAARIRQASASLRREGASLFPQIDLTAEAGGETLDPGSSETNASFGSLFSWELDVWGRIRSGVRARQRELDASIQDWLGGRLLVSAAVAETRFLILEQRARLAVLAQQIETNETLLGLVRHRVGQGISSRVDLLQQERQLDATRALVPPAEAELAAAQYALDALAGRPPGHGPRDSRRTLPDPPPLPAAGLPSDLLKNRPDLLARWNRILALDAEVGQALADRFPRFAIGASAAGGRISDVRALAAGLATTATAPVADGGARRAEVERRRALLEDALAGYANAWLEAVRDVESAIGRERKQAQRIALTARQLATTRETLDETRIRYSQGLTDYLPVIDALTSVQVLELSLVSQRREALALRVALHRALGGPMPQVQPPAPAT